MPIEITIPRLGWSMEEGNLVNWLKKDGEAVKSGEPLFTLENEKAMQDVEAIDNGILRISANDPKPGQIVKVGQVIGHLLQENESSEMGTIPSSRLQLEPAQEASAETRSEIAGNSSASSNEANTPIVTRISPRARRLAADLGIDVTRLSGTGPAGRITEQDVREAANRASSSGQ
jgi:pyruvate dehydrogenase E2 component (dihydrolipoamide acetyltransferase)